MGETNLDLSAPTRFNICPGKVYAICNSLVCDLTLIYINSLAINCSELEQILILISLLTNYIELGMDYTNE